MQCYRHPKVETFLACGRCGRPICPNCAVPGPAGMRCRECASLRSNALYKAHPGRLALALIAGLIVGTIGAEILLYVSFFILFVAPAYGAGVAEMILRITGRKRGHMIEAIGVGSLIAGALIAFGLHLAMALTLLRAAAAQNHAVLPAGQTWQILLAGGLLGWIWPAIGICIAVGVCYARLRE